MELRELFLEAFEAHGSFNDSVWVSVGDANEPPRSSLIGETHKSKLLGGSCVRKDVALLGPWRSDRGIDWFATNQTSGLSGLTIDHFGCLCFGS